MQKSKIVYITNINNVIISFLIFLDHLHNWQLCDRWGRLSTDLSAVSWWWHGQWKVIDPCWCRIPNRYHRTPCERRKRQQYHHCPCMIIFFLMNVVNYQIIQMSSVVSLSLCLLVFTFCFPLCATQLIFIFECKGCAYELLFCCHSY